MAKPSDYPNYCRIYFSLMVGQYQLLLTAENAHSTILPTLPSAINDVMNDVWMKMLDQDDNDEHPEGDPLTHDVSEHDFRPDYHCTFLEYINAGRKLLGLKPVEAPKE